ncbi:MAG: glutamate-1-semialdehyde 2,1-aminomutase [Acidimicrobiales bacterium]
MGNTGYFERACRVIPGGVNSPVRSFAAVGGTPYFVARGRGAYVWDVEDRAYLDYVQSYGASILGHAHPDVSQAIGRAALAGSTFGAPTPGEVELAEAICDRVPGCSMVRLTSSGTEAAMSAVRVARGFTGRSQVIKFAGCYHGHSDGLLAAGGSGVATLGVPDSAGIPASMVAETVVAPYNRVPEIGPDVACVVVEPVAANMGVVAPIPGFLQGLRDACDQAGALLIFDEVITGFRLGRAGASGYFGVAPDLWCFGKVIGGGLPIGAFGGRSDVMGALAPTGPVYQAGTLSGNPLATAAGMAVLGHLDDGAYEELAARAGHLAHGLASVLADEAVTATVPVVGPLVGLSFGPDPVVDYDQARRVGANGSYAVFFHAMLDQGIALAPGAYEAIFPSLAHTEGDINRTLESARLAARAVVRALEG